MPNHRCTGGSLEEEAAGRDGGRGRLVANFEDRDDSDAAEAGGLATCPRVRVARGLSLTGGLGGGDDLGWLLKKLGLNLRISVPRMGVTSDGMGWREGRA